MDKREKFTPGPWRAEKHEGKTEIWSANNFIATTMHELFYSNEKHGMEPANAHLIAAAPDMYTALIQARGLIIQLCNDIKTNYGIDNDANTLLRVRGIDEAIDKARGES